MTDNDKITEKQDAVAPAPEVETEEMALDDARRLKVLSPGMLVFKRFIRNRLADNFFPDSGLPVVLELRSRRSADADDAAHTGRRQAAAGVKHRKQAAERAVEKRQQRGRR